MNIEKNITGSSASIKVIGRLDTTTAPQLEAAIDDCIAGSGSVSPGLGLYDEYVIGLPCSPETGTSCSRQIPPRAK